VCCSDGVDCEHQEDQAGQTIRAGGHSRILLEFPLDPLQKAPGRTRERVDAIGWCPVVYYLTERGRHRAIRAYEEGYRRQPEGAEVEALAQATAEALDWEDWE